MTAPERQPDAIGFALRDPYPWADLAGLVRAGEAAGYRALFLPEVGPGTPWRPSRAWRARPTGSCWEPASCRSWREHPRCSRWRRRPCRALRRAAPPRPGNRAGRPGRPPAAPRHRRRSPTRVRGGAAAIDGAAVTTGLAPVTPPPDLDRGPRPARDAAGRGDRRRRHPQLVHARARCDRRGPGGAGCRRCRSGSGVGHARRLRARRARAGSAEAARAAAAEYASYPAYRRQFVELGIDPTDAGQVVRAVMVTEGSSARDRLAAYRAAGAHLPIVYPVVPGGAPAAALAPRLRSPIAEAS
jgi:hypothetical protein